MKTRTLLSLASLLAAVSAFAQSLTEGEVRKVDKDAKKITLKHGPIKNVDMPAMTMAFKVKNPALLETVKAGDRVEFAVEKTGDDYVVTRIEKKKQ